MVYHHRYWKGRDPLETQCADCGVLATEVEHFQIHHKNGRDFDNSPENLVGLCISCHRDRHREMDTVTTIEEWKEAFKESLLS